MALCRIQSTGNACKITPCTPVLAKRAPPVTHSCPELYRRPARRWFRLFFTLLGFVFHANDAERSTCRDRQFINDVKNDSERPIERDERNTRGCLKRLIPEPGA